MNWRLLSESEKKGNKRARISRCKMREKDRRRQFMFRRLAPLLATTVLLEEVLTPEEGFALAYRSLQKGRALEPLIQLRLCRDQADGLPAVSPVDTPLQSISAQVIHRSRRSKVCPNLLPPVRPALPAGMSFLELVAEAESWEIPSFNPLVTLDQLHTFSGCWKEAADLELRLGLIASPLEPEVIAETARAREFWSMWSAGFHHYQTAKKAGLLPQFEDSNWTCFDHSGLMELLPGVKLPRSVQRDFYLLLLEGSVIRRDQRLVICSRHGLPLAIHPLG